MCLNCTYFKYDNTFYQQIHGTAIGSPLSPVVANLFMESLETKAIQSARHPPKFYKRYVDDSNMINIKERFADGFINHLNEQDENIKFTIEKEENRELALLCNTEIQMAQSTPKFIENKLTLTST